MSKPYLSPLADHVKECIAFSIGKDFEKLSLQEQTKKFMAYIDGVLSTKTNASNSSQNGTGCEILSNNI